MPTPALTTIIQRVEALPEAAQNQQVEQLREYLADWQAEAACDQMFAKTQAQLGAAAQRARPQIAAGKATPRKSPTSLTIPAVFAPQSDPTSDQKSAGLRY
jgi:hypothetical protein